MAPTGSCTSVPRRSPRGSVSSWRSADMDEPTPILAAVYRGKPDEIAAPLGARPAPTVFEAPALGDAAPVPELAALDPAAVAQRRPDGSPPLHLASHVGDGDAVEDLLE